MSDVEARALGAGDVVAVGDKTYRVSPASLRDLKEVQRAAVAYFKRGILDTYRGEIETLGRDWYSKKVEEVSRIDIDGLPKKRVFQVGSIDINDKIEARLQDLFGELPRVTDEETGEKVINKMACYAMLSVGLAGGDIKPEDIQGDTGKLPRRIAVAYDNWWITNCYEGMTTLAFVGVRKHQPDITREEIEKWPMDKITEIAHLVDSLTAPEMGNI